MPDVAGFLAKPVMRSVSPLPCGGSHVRRFNHYTGLFFDDFCSDSAWLRENGELSLPPLEGVETLVLKGEFRPHPDARGVETSAPTLEVRVNGKPAGSHQHLRPGLWDLRVRVPKEQRALLTLHLGGVGLTNTFAWLGRVTGLKSLQRFRAQNKNRQLRLSTISTDQGEVIYDFSQRHAPFSAAFLRQHAKLGLNIAGFLTADLGVGESARCMVRAADAAKLPSALVPLKLHCKNRLGDLTYSERLQETNPHPVNVIHIDPPASRDIDHHHGPGFRAGKYNIGYFAWEQAEFPDAWVPAIDYYDEIWCPSDFTRESIEMKSPVPVVTMPHAISFPRPVDTVAVLRARFALPPEKFLFLSLFDLNSYAERKNPRAALEAFRLSGLAEAGAALVIKVQNAAGNAADFARLHAALRELPGTVLITDTLPRADIYALEAACDCFLSLHRAEGFGLAVAECMYLGKPVISTNWSATAEFVNVTNGCPVDCQLVTLDRHHGPYAKGSTWAEPSVKHAAEWMKILARDRHLATSLGAAARLTMETRFSPEVVGARYRRRLEGIAAF
jgi:glycosyltransferase involved in cell wall biosynthesis